MFHVWYSANYLQFIRLNGVVVDGLVGLVLHPLLVVAGIN